MRSEHVSSERMVGMSDTVTVPLYSTVEDAWLGISRTNFSQATYVTFTWKDGLTIYRQDGEVILRTRDGLLGYDGSGADISNDVLQRLGVTRRQMDNLHKKVEHRTDYVVSVAKQSHKEVNPVLQKMIPWLYPQWRVYVSFLS